MLQKLLVLLLQLQAVWSGLIVPCMQPEAWKACTSDHDEWLYPVIRQAWDLKTGRELPYQQEADILEK